MATIKATNLRELQKDAGYGLFVGLFIGAWFSLMYALLSLNGGRIDFWQALPYILLFLLLNFNFNILIVVASNALLNCNQVHQLAKSFDSMAILELVKESRTRRTYATVNL